MKRKNLFLLALLNVLFIYSQNPYVVTTSSSPSNPENEETYFTETNFPLLTVCQWEPGIRFMFIPDSKDRFKPLLTSAETGRDIDNDKFRYKILEFKGTEEVEKETYVSTNYHTRFLFVCEEQELYHEVKNQRLSDICAHNPKYSLNGLIYLSDVDKARDLLPGKVLYTKSPQVRKDDTNSHSGYREVSLPLHTRVTVTQVGAGSKAYLVKIIFEDDKGESYYMEVALSKTNSGMDTADFTADKKFNYFPNAFTFNDPNAKASEALKSKYTGLALYPKISLEVSPGSIENKESHTLLKYTPLTIEDIENVSDSPSNAILKLKDRNGNIYYKKVDLKYDIFIKNNDYIEDLFGFGDLRKKYPSITEENWALISQGEIRPGMSTEECRLALGSPIQIQQKRDSRFETWFYQGQTVEFENGKILRTEGKLL
ncbi:MAG: hypothetical protein LUF85_11400 [Bacteroides sp.]|nr:hypothetical protein [Bacteroides sp.]